MTAAEHLSDVSPPPAGIPAEATTPGPAGGGEPLTVVDAPAESTATSGRHIVRGSVWFVVAVSAGSALSLLYQVIAARKAPQEVYGVGSALWALAQFMNYATGMGLPVAVAKLGGGEKRTVNTLFVWALIYTAVSSLVGTALFGLAAPRMVRDEILDALWRFGVPFGLLLLFLLITGMSFAVLVEVRLVTQRRWGWVLGRVVAVGVLRLPLLYVPAVARSPIALLLLIAGTPAASGFIGAVALRFATPAADRGPLLPLPAETAPALRYATVNYFGTLASQAPQFVIPLVVAAYASSSENGAFYLAWLVTVVVFLLPHTIGQVVLAEGSRHGARTEHQVRTGLKLAVGLMVAITIAATLGAPIVPVLFGSGYQLTADLLPRLVAASIPWAVTAILLARARVEAHHPRTVLITLGFALFTLVPASVLTASSGTVGTANAWLVGNVLAAVLAVAVTVAMPSRTAA